MIDTITVKVSELYNLAKQLKNDGMDFVEVSIVQDDSTSAPLPDCLNFSAFSEKMPEAFFDYDCIDGISEDTHN